MSTDEAGLGHTHTLLTAFFPGLPRWAGTRKVEPILILLKQETVSGSGISWARCKYAPCSRQVTMPAPHHSVFYRPDALPVAQPTASKHWRHGGRARTVEITRFGAKPNISPPGCATKSYRTLTPSTECYWNSVQWIKPAEIGCHGNVAWGIEWLNFRLIIYSQTPPFTGILAPHCSGMPFLPPTRQCRSTEGKFIANAVDS